jgi:DNA polymerase/3'-5' exonuclease PolX
LEGNRGKAMAYRNAIGRIKAFKEEIICIEQVNNVPGIGDGIKKKIKEVLENGKFREVVSSLSDEKINQLTDFESIWGVGIVRAKSLLKEGYKSIK